MVSNDVAIPDDNFESIAFENKSVARSPNFIVDVVNVFKNCFLERPRDALLNHLNKARSFAWRGGGICLVQIADKFIAKATYVH